MITAAVRETISKALDIDPEQILGYPASYVECGEGRLLLCKIAGAKKILAMGKGALFSRLHGSFRSEAIKLCPLSHENRLILNQYLPFTLPSAFGRKTATFGAGDRLGLATPGHIRSFRNCSAKPVLAQQSKRELSLTGRDYEKVLDDVCFAVFQEGYRGGFSADGDHLKKPEDIVDALNYGYTMITLDCSDMIGRGIEGLSESEAEAAYAKFPPEFRNRIENAYLSKGFPIDGEEYFFNRDELIRCALIYSKAVDFVREIYFDYLKKADRQVDFELSIDETESVTTAQGHLFVAMELEDNNVEVTSLAPRFIGEFQKGIDYIGDIDEFESQLRQHAAIAHHFGYKLSIHSGSDKFSVFPIIGKYTEGILHVKTSGTSWLEAIGTIAEKNPALYRKIHQKALEHFEESKVHYYVSGDPSRIEDLKFRKDEVLIDYLENDDSRQLLHITYGFVLGDAELKKELYETLEKNEDYYYDRLASHIGRHLELINLTD
ncbi:MAG TPA: tagaturonate epimerase family protein [Anaerovoracaceae bacterium]|nr:tagaturonate epimerase family protein [Anaerovoracaceae bacterium]